jgi:hypothetical protein
LNGKRRNKLRFDTNVHSCHCGSITPSSHDLSAVILPGLPCLSLSLAAPLPLQRISLTTHQPQTVRKRPNISSYARMQITSSSPRSHFYGNYGISTRFTTPPFIPKTSASRHKSNVSLRPFFVVFAILFLSLFYWLRWAGLKRPWKWGWYA